MLVSVGVEAEQTDRSDWWDVRDLVYSWVWGLSCAIKRNGHRGRSGNSFRRDDACVNGSLESDDKTGLNFWNQ